MKKIGATVLAILVSSLASSQNTQTPAVAPLQRQVRERRIISNELPSADLTFGQRFRYVGGQVVNLYGNAEAEQHLFVSGDKAGIVQSFYWIQFEHFLPSNRMTYDYQPTRTTDVGGLQFIYDVKRFSNYADLETDDPASDGAAIRKLVAEHNLAFPQRTVRVRMFHLPTADRRSELMIIYGESWPEDSKIPASNGGIPMDDAYPAAAKTILDHAREGLAIRKH
jgi:hypothetical protein